MMTAESLLGLLRAYQDKFANWPAERCDGDYYKPGMGRQIKHARWMMDEMVTRLEAGTVELDKANRWLGFIQSIFWINGLCTIDEMREHVINGLEKIE